jgi:Ca2+/Na+ antiporter
MKILLGIFLIIVALSSGGMGLAMMGGALSIPMFLVLGFGIYFIFSYLNEKKSTKKIFNNKKPTKNSSNIFLGILILIFGVINLINGSLIIISLCFIVVGVYLIFGSNWFSGSTSENENIEEVYEPVKIKKKTDKTSFWFYAIGIPLIFITMFLLFGTL